MPMVAFRENVMNVMMVQLLAFSTSSIYSDDALYFVIFPTLCLSLLRHSQRFASSSKFLCIWWNKHKTWYVAILVFLFRITA